MALTEENLVGYLRSHFRKSAGLRVWQFSVQLAIAVPAALSVVITSNFGSYALAIAGVVLLGVWWLVTNSYTGWRNGAHAARRAALIAGGVAKPFTPSTILNITGKMKVTQHESAAAQQANYYATKQPIGPERLAEMVEESAFYSAPLQRASAKAMLLAIVILMVAAGIAALSTLPFVEHGTSLLIIRLILSGFVFAMSSDVLGAYIAHRDAAAAIEDVRERMASLASTGYPLSDVLLAMTDYNSAVESAPESVPWAYWYMERNLNERWAEYQSNRDAARAASPVPVA